MKFVVVLIAVTLAGLSSADAGSTRGYYRKSGTYIPPSYRSQSDSTVRNNYTFRGNSNPYNGKTGTNSYRHDYTSPYFNGTPYKSGQYGHANP